MPNIIVFDIETGGFLTPQHKYGLTEFAAIALDSETLEEIGRYESGIIAPYINLEGNETEYTIAAQQITGIYIEAIKSGRSDHKVIGKEIVDFANSVKAKGRFGAPILAGHNIDVFDLPFLSQFFEIIKRDPSKNFSKTTMDTLWWSRLKFQEQIESHALPSCAAACGVEIIDAHRAINDVIANVEVVRTFLRALRGGGGVNAITQNNQKRYRPEFRY